MQHLLDSNYNVWAVSAFDVLSIALSPVSIYSVWVFLLAFSYSHILDENDTGRNMAIHVKNCSSCF